jgi:hypothetical protein
MPVPRWMPSRGNNQLPTKDPQDPDYQITYNPEAGSTHDLTC